MRFQTSKNFWQFIHNYRLWRTVGLANFACLAWPNGKLTKTERKKLLCKRIAVDCSYWSLIAEAPTLSECYRTGASLTSLTLSWQPAAGAVYYTLANDTARPSVTTSETSAVIIRLKADTTYTFNVTVYGRNATGNSVSCQASTCMLTHLCDSCISIRLENLFCHFYRLEHSIKQLKFCELTRGHIV